MLRQIKWELPNGPTTKNGVLPATNLLFRKFCFSLTVSVRRINQTKTLHLDNQKNLQLLHSKSFY